MLSVAQSGSDELYVKYTLASLNANHFVVAFEETAKNDRTPHYQDWRDSIDAILYWTLTVQCRVHVRWMPSKWSLDCVGRSCISSQVSDANNK